MKKIFIVAAILFIIITVILISIIGFMLLNGYTLGDLVLAGVLLQVKPSEKTYDEAKEETIIFLNDNIDNLQDISKSILKIKSNSYKEHKYKDKTYVYSYMQNEEGKEYIQIDFDGQGMLGGQGWGLIYSDNDDLLNGNSYYIYDEKEQTGTGNNIFIKEKIKDKWYFYYDDWDGKVVNWNRPH